MKNEFSCEEDLLSERLIEKIRFRSDQFDRIEKEYNEISEFTNQLQSQLKKDTKQSNDENDKEEMQELLSTLKEMIKRKSMLNRQKQKLNSIQNQPQQQQEVESKLSSMNIDDEYEVEEEEEEDDDDDDEEYLNEKFETIKREENEFLDLMKQMFLLGLDKEFDYSKIDINSEYNFPMVGENIDDTLQNDYFGEPDHLINESRCSTTFNLGGNDQDFDYEAEYQQSLLEEKEETNQCK
eukprot:gene9913-12156_t